MDALELIKPHIDMYKLLLHYDFHEVKQDSTMIRACCKLHGGNNPSSFVVNAETGLWYCHTSDCGGGDAYTLVQRMEGFGFIDSVKWMASFFNVDIGNAHIIERKANYLLDLKKFVSTMKRRKKKEFPNFTPPERVQLVRSYRNFKEDTIDFFKLGYVDEITLEKKGGETYVLRNRLVFPIIFQETCVGISLRRTKSRDFPKWSHQPTGIETGALLYNYDNVYNKKYVVVCEGITDVWAFHEIGANAVATFGAHVTDEQYKLLLKLGADLIFAYDGDEAGQHATQNALRMFRNKANTSVIPFSQGQDPENIPREELKKLYDNAKRA